MLVLHDTHIATDVGFYKILVLFYFQRVRQEMEEVYYQQQQHDKTYKVKEIIMIRHIISFFSNNLYLSSEIKIALTFSPLSNLK